MCCGLVLKDGRAKTFVNHFGTWNVRLTLPQIATAWVGLVRLQLDFRSQVSFRNQSKWCWDALCLWSVTFEDSHFNSAHPCNSVWAIIFLELWCKSYSHCNMYHLFSDLNFESLIHMKTNFKNVLAIFRLKLWSQVLFILTQNLLCVTHFDAGKIKFHADC